jgi:dTDP-4-amino-4,6-dideoxygalactose transaminase
MPLHEQPAFSAYRAHECPVATRAARELLSLPLHPGLAGNDVETVVNALRNLDRRDVLA